MNPIVRKTIEGWIDKASNQLSVAKEHAKSPYRSSEAIEAAQECVELSVKSVLTFLNIKYPRAHEWPAEGKAFGGIAQQVRDRQLLARLESQHLAHSVRIPRLLLLLNFWAQFYLVAKYGFETEHLASARELFEMSDAQLAVCHAEECWRAALELRHLSEDNLALLVSDSAPAQGV